MSQTPLASMMSMPSLPNTPWPLHIFKFYCYGNVHNIWKTPPEPKPPTPLIYFWIHTRGLSQVDLAYVIWKQTNFALDLWLEKLICGLKTWFGIWKLISKYLQFLKYNIKRDRSMNKINYKHSLTIFAPYINQCNTSIAVSETIIN